MTQLDSSAAEIVLNAFAKSIQRCPELLNQIKIQADQGDKEAQLAWVFTERLRLKEEGKDESSLHPTILSWIESIASEDWDSTSYEEKVNLTALCLLLGGEPALKIVQDFVRQKRTESSIGNPEE